MKIINHKNINLVLKILFSLSGVVFLVLSFIDSTTWYKPMSYAATIIMPWLVDILNKVFKLKISRKLETAYLAFTTIAMILGIDLDWYKNIYIFGVPCYDKVAHTLSGVFAAFVAKDIINKCYDGFETKSSKNVRIKKWNYWFVFLFIVSFVALTAAGWECYEFLYDQITGGNMQELIAPGVSDTMWDIIGALGFGIVTAFFLSKKD